MLVPENIQNFDSDGEKILYNKFNRDFPGNRAFILHSVFIQHHIKNISGELDFLLLIPNEGIFAIEVKHGRVSRINGEWQYQNRKGLITKSNKSPFMQVNASMNSLRKFIDHKLSNDKALQEKFSKFLWGTGIAFTSLDEIPEFGQEGFNWQILTRSGLNHSLLNYINKISQGWHQELRNKHFYDFYKSRPTLNDCQKLLKLIRGDFDFDYKPLNKILNQEVLIDQFTEEQFNTLSIMSYNPRCVVQGAAGTGKTILAIEQFRRLNIEGKRVAFFCFNVNLGLFIKTKFAETLNNSEINNFHSFLQGGLKNVISEPDFDNNYFSLTLPFNFILDNEYAEDNKFDYLIIDEAQDLITDEYIDVFNAILKGGLSDGKWTFYGDFNNQSIYANNKEIILDILRTKSFFVNVPELTINCRNTQKISFQNKLFTGIKLPSNFDTQIEGEKIKIEFINEEDAVIYIEKEINNLYKSGVSLNKISILSFKNINKSILSNNSSIVEFIKNGLTFDTVHSYKGLENSIIFLIDFLDPTLPDSLQLNYIALSRAKFKLYLLIDKALKNSYEKLIQSNNL